VHYEDARSYWRRKSLEVKTRQNEKIRKVKGAGVNCNLNYYYYYFFFLYAGRGGFSKYLESLTRNLPLHRYTIFRHVQAKN